MALQTSLLGPVGDGLLDYLDSGIVLADVYERNLGFIEVDGHWEVAVTDPGHAVFLTDRYDRLAIPTL
jgi:hypothetical protein